MPLYRGTGRIAKLCRGTAALAKVYRGTGLVWQGFESEAAALFAAMSVQPSDARKLLINEAIKSLKAAGLWSKLSLLYVHAAHDVQAGRLNWKSPTSALTNVGAAPPFTADIGFTGDGTNALAGPTLGSLSPGYVVNNAHMGVWTLRGVVNGGIALGEASSTAPDARIEPRNSSGLLSSMLNDGTAATVAVPDSIGHFVTSRSASGSYARYKDGVSLGAASITSTSVHNQAVRILGHGAARSTHRIAVSHWGSALNATEAADLTTILSTYLTALGAIAAHEIVAVSGFGGQRLVNFGGTSVNMPSGTAEGDTLVWLNFAFGSGSVADTTPSGWTKIQTNVPVNVVGRLSLFTRIAPAGYANQSVAGLSFTDGYANHCVKAFRYGQLPQALTVVGATGQQTDGDPSPQTQIATVASIVAPLIVVAAYGVGIGNQPNPRDFSPAADGELVGAENALKWKIYNKSPQTTTIDMEDEGQGNILQSATIQVS